MSLTVIGLEFLHHGNCFAALVRRHYFSVERSESQKYICVRRLLLNRQSWNLTNKYSHAAVTLYPPKAGECPAAASNPADTRMTSG